MPHTLSRRTFLANAAAVPAVAFVPAGIATGKTYAVLTESLIETERDAVHSAMKGSDIGAAAVCLVEGGQVRWAEGFGYASGHGSAAVDVSTMFSIQSTSKNFAAVAVLLAVQDGILDLDAPITRYLPSFTVHSRFEHSPQERITLRLLLANRAGFTHEAPLGNNYELASPGFDAHVRSISQTWLRYPVGTRYRYSNLGFDLAGHILEQAAGVDYPQWLRRRIFEPLGMHESTADASVYLASKGRALGTQEGFVQVPTVTPLVVSGGVWTSAADMAKYLGFMLTGGKAGTQQLLAPDLWDEMHGFGLGGDYGLGVMRSERRYGSTPVRLLHHRGGGFGFGCVFTYCPQAHVGFAAMFNRAASAGYGFGERLLDQLLSARFGPRQPRVPVSSLAPIRLNQSQLQRMAGNWIGRSAKAKIVVAGNGELLLRREANEAGTRLAAIDCDQLFTEGADGEVATYRYHEATDMLPAHLECTNGEDGLDQNDAMEMPAGPNAPHWLPWLGRYRIDQWGKPSMSVVLEQRQGWLYIDGIRLVTEVEPGLLFTSDGEAVDFRGPQSTWRNLRLQRVRNGDAG
ncbi:serine hydrolase domain-containing protein [Stenotrophomonas sp. CC120222-04]|uniref:serine hydrolase domain-containing protein n=1 Tax=unclassified Stenotrophomonas TaxID=196198 RepID=UPI000B6AA0AA|nr:serine hydrolase domain-containing protein [Stenotrophomonas sp. CC120222-04]SNT83028.1 CubicO group peptidase, beta-lactamase class C family [Stenotrophomonas sp. CC120222-04]